MTIRQSIAGQTVTLSMEGRLDTTTAPQLEALVDQCLPQAEALILDCGGLEYVSSAGLRVILKAQKAMLPRGGMKLTRVNEVVMEVFDITGFADILNIE